MHFIFLTRKRKIVAESQYPEFMFFRPNLGFITIVMHGGASPQKTSSREQFGKTLVSKRSFWEMFWILWMFLTAGNIWPLLVPSMSPGWCFLRGRTSWSSHPHQGMAIWDCRGWLWLLAEHSLSPSYGRGQKPHNEELLSKFQPFFFILEWVLLSQIQAIKYQIIGKCSQAASVYTSL